MARTRAAHGRAAANIIMLNQEDGARFGRNAFSMALCYITSNSNDTFRTLKMGQQAREIELTRRC
jgi:hypothetical protein